MVQRKKIWIVLFPILVLSTSALAQSGFRRLLPDKLAIGMGYQCYRPPTRTNAPFRFYPQTLLGNLEYAFSRDLKLALLPGVSFFDIVSQSPADDKILTFREKQLTCSAGYINAGVYLFDETIAEVFPKDTDSFSIKTGCFPNVHGLYTLQADANWIDIGVSERLAYARQHFQNGDFQ